MKVTAFKTKRPGHILLSERVKEHHSIVRQEETWIKKPGESKL